MMADTSYSKAQIEQLEAMERVHFWNRGRNQLILLRLQSLSIKCILDVGCGTGALVSQLAQKGYQATGIDLQGDGLNRRKKREPFLHLIEANATKLPFHDGQFEAVILADVLEHLEEREVLKEIFRVLAPQGILLLTVPAFPRLWSQRDVEAGHLRRYAPADIRLLAKQCKGQLECLGFYQFFLFPLFVLSRFFNVKKQSEQSLPTWLNALFFKITVLEIWLGKWIQWPWGSSILAIIRKIEHTTPTHLE